MSDAPQGASLDRLSCSAPTACTAVGSFLNANPPAAAAAGTSGHGVTLVERWDGRRWSLQATPNPACAAQSELGGVSCSAPKTRVAVGYYTNAAGEEARTLAMRWNGTRWSIQPSPNPGRETWSQLTDVSCWSRDGCIAVGTLGSGAPLAERWNGKRWSLQRIPRLAGGPNGGFAGVSCPSPSSCVAVGSAGSDADLSSTEFDTGTLAAGWNGMSWSVQRAKNAPAAHDNALAGVSYAAAKACAAVGSWVYSGEQPSGGGGGLANRWNGAGWSIQPVADPAGATGSGLLGVSCPSRTACTAVGAFTNSAGATLPFAERYG